MRGFVKIGLGLAIVVGALGSGVQAQQQLSAADIEIPAFKRPTTLPMRLTGRVSRSSGCHKSVRASDAIPGRSEAAPYGN